MYEKIRRHPTVRDLWAQTLAERGVVTAEDAAERMDRAMARLQEAYDSLDPERDLHEPYPKLAPPGTARRVDTTVPLEELHALNEALLTLPEGFTMHPKLARMMERRRGTLGVDDGRLSLGNRQIAGDGIDLDGIPIRFTGGVGAARSTAARRLPRRQNRADIAARHFATGSLL